MVRSLSFSRALPRRAGSLLVAGSLAVLGIIVSPVHAATTGAVQSYLVVYRSGVSSSAAAAQVQGAGGALVYNYQQIGVAVAKSNRSDFASNLQSSSGIDSVVATARGAARLRNQEPDATASDSSSAGADPTTGVLAPLQ